VISSALASSPSPALPLVRSDLPLRTFKPRPYLGRLCEWSCCTRGLGRWICLQFRSACCSLAANKDEDGTEVEDEERLVGLEAFSDASGAKGSDFVGN
jgi:hypothetical protein